MDIIPNFWVLKEEITAARPISVFIPYAGPNQYRQAGDGSEIHHWLLANNDSQYENFLVMRSFWRAHYPGVGFYLYDPILDETRTYEITSDFANEYNHQDSFSWSFTISEIYPYVRILGVPAEGEVYGEITYG